MKMPNGYLNPPTIPEVRDRFAAYHRRHPEWGPLHVAMADGNVSGDDVVFCLHEAEQLGDTEGAELARILLAMSRMQRRKLSRMAHEPVSP